MCFFQQQSTTIEHKGHEFIPVMFHMPTSCEICAKPVWHVFKPPPALGCKRKWMHFIIQTEDNLHSFLRLSCENTQRAHGQE